MTRLSPIPPYPSGVGAAAAVGGAAAVATLGGLNIAISWFMEELISSPRESWEKLRRGTGMQKLIEWLDEDEQKPEEKNDEQYNNRNKLQGQRVEIENAGGQIANKIRKKAFRQPIVGGSAKAYASAMKKMKNEKKNTTTTTTLQQKQQQQKKKINPKSDNLSTMILPIATSYFNLRDQIFKLKDVINKKDIELKKTNSKCTQLETDAKICFKEQGRFIPELDSKICQKQQGALLQ